MSLAVCYKVLRKETVYLFMAVRSGHLFTGKRLSLRSGLSAIGAGVAARRPTRCSRRSDHVRHFDQVCHVGIGKVEASK